MTFRNKIALLMIVAAIQIPCAGHAAEEDKDLALIAAEQADDDEQLDKINPALTDSISTERTQETDKEIRARKKKLEQARKEKERENERKLKESTTRNEARRRDERTIIIDPSEPVAPPPEPIIEQPPTFTQPPTTAPTPVQQPINEMPPTFTPPTIETQALPNSQDIYAEFAQVARAVKFIPLYMPRKSGYEITALYASNGVAEVRYGRRWEPAISLTVRTYKRADGEALQDISGVTGVKWRVDTTTGTTLYIAKISETVQVAAWAVGHYTFSAQAQNLSYAGFHSLVSDELIELSTHYYLDL